jgi:hypothetical protein
MAKAISYKGCVIRPFQGGGYVWEERHYGAESDDVFPNVEDAKRDIDLFFGNGPAPREIDGEIYA